MYIREVANKCEIWILTENDKNNLKVWKIEVFGYMIGK